MMDAIRPSADETGHWGSHVAINPLDSYRPWNTVIRRPDLDPDDQRAARGPESAIGRPFNGSPAAAERKLRRTRPGSRLPADEATGPVTGFRHRDRLPSGPRAPRRDASPLDEGRPTCAEEAIDGNRSEQKVRRGARTRAVGTTGAGKHRRPHPHSRDPSHPS